MNDQQLREVAVHRRRLDARADLSEEMRQFLMELRELMVLAGISHERLARRISKIGTSAAEGEALPGYTADGRYSSSNMSDQLLGKGGRLPRPLVLRAVAELYVDKVESPPTSVSEVLTHLNTLGRAAEIAQQRFAEGREDAAIDSGREPGGLAYRRLRESRDQARVEADELRSRVVELETSSQLDAEEISRLNKETRDLEARLESRLAALKEQLLKRDDQLIEVELRVDEQDRQLTGAGAHIDQLEAEVAGLHEEVTSLRQRLDRSWWQRFRQHPPESDRTDAEQDGEEQVPPEGTPVEPPPSPPAGGGAQHELGEDDPHQGVGSGSTLLRQPDEPPSRPDLLPRVAMLAMALIVVSVIAVPVAAAGHFWPGPLPTRSSFEQCVRNRGLVANPGVGFPRTFLEWTGLASTPPQRQYYVIEVPGGTSLGSVTFATSAQEATQTIRNSHAFYSYYKIPDNQFTVGTTNVVDPHSRDGTGALLTSCVLAG